MSADHDPDDLRNITYWCDADGCEAAETTDGRAPAGWAVGLVGSGPFDFCPEHLNLAPYVTTGRA